MTISTYKKFVAQPVENFGRVAVLMGGTSSERDISLNSGTAVLNGLLERGVDAFALDLGDTPVQQILGEKIDRAFIALHGPGGEDGKVQALLRSLNIPFTGSDFASSSIAMDKLKTKLVWQALGLPTPRFEVLEKSSDYEKVLQSLGGACFVKPVTEGSSLGIRMVCDAESLAQAHAFAMQFDADVIAESTIVGREFTVSIVNDLALPIIELKTNNPFYDFEAKYVSDDTTYICPADLDSDKEKEIKHLALTAFSALSCRSWGRIDFMQDEHENFFLLEANTVPGMTSHSLVPMAAKAAGLSFNDLLIEILAGSL